MNLSKISFSGEPKKETPTTESPPITTPGSETVVAGTSSPVRKTLSQLLAERTNPSVPQQSAAGSTSIAIRPPAPKPEAEVIEPARMSIEKNEALRGPAGFKAKLKSLDELIQDRDQISPFEMDAARGYVVEIFRELRTFPEYDGMMVAKDVRNISHYINSTVSSTEGSFKITAGKREKAKAKKASQYSADDMDLSALMGPEIKAAPKKKEPVKFIAMDLSTLNTDTIKPLAIRGQKK